MTIAISRHPMLDPSWQPRYVGLAIPAHIRQLSYADIPLGMLAQPYLAMSAWPMSVNHSLGQSFIMSLGHALTLLRVIP
jgi:hypothetical protein